MTDEALASVQRSALERALVDDSDARRYFALAGALDVAYAESSPSSSTDESGRVDAAPEAEGLLPVALLSLTVIPHLVESTTAADIDAASSHTLGSSPAAPLSTVSPGTDPWQPDHDAMQHAVTRGARLALRWFDVSVDRVAARAGLPRATLVSSDR